MLPLCGPGVVPILLLNDERTGVVGSRNGVYEHDTLDTLVTHVARRHLERSGPSFGGTTGRLQHRVVA
jgi:hypothetical protein